MAASTNLLPWIIALALAALAAGVLLLILGRGRRLGDEPHCRKCGYDLTGLTTERCPECGRPAVGRNVVIGTRRRRWRLLAPGLALLLLAVTSGGYLGVNSTRGVNWHAYLPTFALTRLAETDDTAAVTELANRAAASANPPTALMTLVPLALQRQGVRPRPPSAYPWTDFLAALEVGGFLSTAQVEQFHEQAVSFSLRFRPRVRQQDDLAITFCTQACGSQRLKACSRVSAATLRIGGFQANPQVLGGDLSQSHWGVDTTVYVPVHRLEPGQYTVEFQARQVFENPTFTRDVNLTYELEVLPPDSADVVKLVRNPDIGQQLRRTIIVGLAKRNFVKPEPGYCDLAVTSTGPVPMDLAFRLLLRAGEREIEVGAVKLKAMPDATERVTGWHYPVAGLEGQWVTPILRTSIDIAKAEPDMVKIWDGELVFPQIQLKPSAPVTSTALSPGVP